VQVRGSRGLKAVLGVALAAGNTLNAGTARGAANGFTLDSLHKVIPRTPARAPAPARMSWVLTSLPEGCDARIFVASKTTESSTCHSLSA